MSDLKKEAVQAALDLLLHHARVLAYIDEGDGVCGDDFFRQLGTVSTELGSLKHAVVRYDETLKFFNKEEENK